MTTVIKASSLGDFASLVPGIIGYVPRESLMAIPMSGNRSIGAMRIDLPEADVPAVQFAQTLASLLLRLDTMTAVALFTYSDGGPLIDLIDTVTDVLASERLPVLDAAHVVNGTWTSYSDLLAEPAVVPAIPCDLKVTGDQFTESTLPEADPVLAAGIATALENLDPGPEQVLDAAEAVLQSQDAETLATLAILLSRPLTRDVALSQWARDRDHGVMVLHAQVGWLEGEDFPVELAQVLFGEGPVPDGERLRDALQCVVRIATNAPDRYRAGVLATAAWLAWALGKSTLAEAYAAQADELEPGHGMAGIVASFVTHGKLPDWAFAGR